MTSLKSQIIQTVGIIVVILSIMIFVFCWVYRRKARLVINIFQTRRVSEMTPAGARDEPPSYPATGSVRSDYPVRLPGQITRSDQITPNRTTSVTTISERLMTYQEATANDKPPSYASINACREVL